MAKQVTRGLELSVFQLAWLIKWQGAGFIAMINTIRVFMVLVFINCD